MSDTVDRPLSLRITQEIVWHEVHAENKRALLVHPHLAVGALRKVTRQTHEKRRHRTEQKLEPTEQNRTEQNRTEQNRTEHNVAVQTE